MAITNHTLAEKAEAGRKAIGADGRAIAKIAKRMGVAPTTVYWWRRKYVAAGSPEPEFVTAFMSPTKAPNGGTNAKMAIALFESVAALKATIDEMQPGDALAILDYLRVGLVAKGAK